MKKLILPLLLVLGACGARPETIPLPPQNLEVVTAQVPVPVLCKIEVERPEIPLDRQAKGRPLEEQNAALRATIAVQGGYTKVLEAAVIGCGGKIISE